MVRRWSREVGEEKEVVGGWSGASSEVWGRSVNATMGLFSIGERQNHSTIQ